MPVYQITPLAPAYLLLLGATLVLVVGPTLAPRRRHGLLAAISGLAVLSLVFSRSGYPADVSLVHVLVEWQGQPALAMRVPAFEPFLWGMMVSVLAISLAGWEGMDEVSLLDQAMFFALAAAACGLVLAGNFRTLAFALLLFDVSAALLALNANLPRPAVGRLLLGVLSSSVVMTLAQGRDYLSAQPSELGYLFSLTVWLRLGLYPLIESEAHENFSWPMQLGFFAINLAVGLYLVPVRSAPWLVWLAGVTSLLHGGLAWLETDRQRGLAHLGYALAGGILTVSLAVGGGLGVMAAALSTLTGVVVLGLTPARLGRPDWAHPLRLWPYLPPLLATLSLVGAPFTLGWEGRGALYQATWGAGLPGTLAAIVVAEGAALAALYRYWRLLLFGPPTQSELGAPAKGTKEGETREGLIWRSAGAAVASLPFLIPVLGPRLLLMVGSSASLDTALPSSPALSAPLGLVGSLLWAMFLGYGRRRLLGALPFSVRGLMAVLRLGWLVRSLARALDTLSRILLRLRAVIEGQHYLAWAILLFTALVLLILFR